MDTQSSFPEGPLVTTLAFALTKYGTSVLYLTLIQIRLVIWLNKILFIYMLFGVVHTKLFQTAVVIWPIIIY